MSSALSVLPDPARPGGGYARLVMPAGSVPTGTAAVSVFNMFRERYLGPAEWQPTEAFFGPYEVATLPDGSQAVTIGPEIVNALEEFVTVKFRIGPFSSVVTWPETVPQLPGAAGIGQILTSGQVEEIECGGLRGRVEKTPPKKDDPQPPPPPPPPPPGPQTRRWWLLALLLALILAGVGAWFYLNREEPVPPVAPVIPDEEHGEEQTTTPPPACSAEAALAAHPAPGEALRSLLDDSAAGRCTGTIDADFGLLMIRNAAQAGSADALMAFGDLYNEAVTDPVIEEELGIVLADDPSLALDYYARARDADAAGAADAIAAVCESIADATDLLVADARREFCP